MKFSLVAFSVVFFWHPAVLAEDVDPYLPFVFHIGYDGGWILQGSVPTMAQRKALEESAASAVPDGEIDSHLMVSPRTIPEPWIDRVPELVGLFLCEAGQELDLSVVDGKVIVQGEAGNREVHERLSEILQGEVPHALALEDRMTVDGRRMADPVPDEPAFVSKSPKIPEQPKAMTAAVVPALTSIVKEMFVQKAETDNDDRKEPISEVESTSASRSSQEGDRRTEAAADAGPDPGGPVLFYFDVASAEIRS